MAHICWVIAELRGGGAERSVIRCVNGLCERGHSVDLVLFQPTNDFPDDISERASVFVLSRRPDRWSRIRRQAANLFRKQKKRYREPSFSDSTHWSMRRLPLVRLPSLLYRLVGKHRWPLRDLAGRQRRAAFVRALRLGRYFEDQKPDVAFTNLVAANKAGFFAAGMTRDCPAIIPIAHNTVEKRETDHCVFSAASRVVAVSRGVADNFTAVVGVQANKITTIYNPVCAPDIGELAKSEPEHPWFSDDGPPVILGVGRLVSQKDFSTLIDAFRHVRANRPCRLVILGDGPLRSALEARIAGFGLDDCVSLPGWVENPFAFMARSALFVLSSRHEGLGNVLVEALACGCPAVSTDCPAGPAEILEDPALLAPVGDVEELARVMQRALDEPADKTALRANAARFSVERSIDGYETLIADVLAGRTNRRLE